MSLERCDLSNASVTGVACQILADLSEQIAVRVVNAFRDLSSDEESILPVHRLSEQPRRLDDVLMIVLRPVLSVTLSIASACRSRLNEHSLASMTRRRKNDALIRTDFAFGESRLSFDVF